MPILFTVSYLANVIVLIPVCYFLITNNKRLVEVYGADSTARQILTCMYITLLMISSYLLLTGNQIAQVAWSILGFQVIYKFISLYLITNKRVPVYWFNFFVAILHGVTLIMNPVNL
jgi:hypothetical protein